jgi:hypothetical protein
LVYQLPVRLKIVLFLLLLSRDASSTLQSLLQVCWARPWRHSITLGLQPFASLEPSSLRVTCTRTSDLRNLCDLLLFEILNKTQSGKKKNKQFQIIYVVVCSIEVLRILLKYYWVVEHSTNLRLLLQTTTYI